MHSTASALVGQAWSWQFIEPAGKPDVSIIICAHDQLTFTLRCLAALNETQHVNLARAEVIVVDDASTDGTLDAVGRIPGLRVLPLQRNHGFLRAANAGLAVARGRHILFLNNDTEPVGRWIDPLLETFDRRADALCVGPRFVFPDGVLQEAGGIILSDGSAQHYGRGLDAFDPRVTYERKVDYASAAALLVDGDFVRGRGGFDERYSPAYYEDVDLCFAAREMGGEVWYQPASIVVHHEGASHGTDETAGTKAYQGVHRQTFQDRWADSLAMHADPRAPALEVGRQRSERGRILVFDLGVPIPDRDAASVRLVAIMELMLALGHSVTFIPLHGARPEPHTRRLERLGIEVLGAPDDWWTHLRALAPGTSHAWICRPDAGDAVLKRIRDDLPRAAVIYDTVDLHFVRLERESLTVGDPELGREALRMQLRELELIEAADSAIVVSSREMEILGAQTRSLVSIVPTVHRGIEAAATPHGRSGILFVGGFLHQPNVDAVEWFATQVLPLVNQRHPQTVLTIVGSNACRRVKALASSNVVVAGWSADLTEHYTAARIAVAPLRFGAGVKGKVGEALSFGVPMVMTPIASEGMHVEHSRHCLISQDPPTMAQQVCQLIEDDDLWARLSAQGRLLVQSHFGPETVSELLAEALDTAAQHRGAPWH